MDAPELRSRPPRDRDSDLSSNARDAPELPRSLRDTRDEGTGGAGGPVLPGESTRSLRATRGDEDGARGRARRPPFSGRVTPIAGALGAEITGVDLSRTLGAAVVAEIRQALLDHLVLFFPAQELTPRLLLAFARRLGDPLAYPQLQGLPEEPLVTAVTKLEHERVAFGGVWHTDTSYLERPPMGSLLYAVELPPFGGDTLFANQYLAYESLSAGLRQTLAGLTAVYTSTKPAVAATREDRLRERGVQAKVLTSEHPVVRTHPETGRKALYVNCGHTSHFEGWSEAESQPLLEYLFQHQVQPEFTCRYRWQPGSLAIWDNRCTQHLPINDYHGYRRVMHRVTLAGDQPF